MPIHHHTKHQVAIAIVVLLGSTASPCVSAQMASTTNMPKTPATLAVAQHVQDEENPNTLTAVEVTAQSSQRYVSESTVGSKEPIKQRGVANSVSIITAERIQDQNLKTVADALNQMTGITVISNDTTQSQYLSRGYALGVSYDGIPHSNSFSGVQQLDLPVYEQIEVLRGPAGVFAGSDNLGGTVNLVRKRAYRSTGIKASLSAGSWANHRSDIDVTGSLNATGTVRARAVFSAQDRDYFYDKTHTRKLLGYGTVDWDLTPSTTASFAVTVQDDDTDASYYGLPAYSDTGGLLDVPRSTNPVAEWNKGQWNTKDYIAEFEHRFGNQWTAKLKMNRRNQDFFFKEAFVISALDRNTNTVNYRRRIVDVNYQRDAIDLFFSGPFSLMGREHQALFGYNLSKLTNVSVSVPQDTITGVSLGAVVPEINAAYSNGSTNETSQSGFYGQVRLSFSDPLTAIVGGRLSDYNYRSRSLPPSTLTNWNQGGKENNHFTPYVGVIYDLNKNYSLYASHSSIFVPQTAQRVDGSIIDPREGRQWEAGIKGEFLAGRLQTSMAYFDMRDINRAYQDPENPDYYLNRGKVQSRGWEFEVAGSPAPGYQIQAGYTRLDTQYLDHQTPTSIGTNFDTWEPRHTLKLWGLKQFAQGTVSGLTMGLGVNVVSESAAGTGNSAIRRQGGYAVTNMLLGYRFSDKLSLQFNANNIFDRTYYTRLGGTNTYNSFGEPRNYSITLQARY